MTLSRSGRRPKAGATTQQEPSSDMQERTVESAMAFLRSLAQLILARLGPSPLNIKLSRMNTMKPPRGTAKAGEAHVLWVGPPEPSPEDEGNERLQDICRFIHLSFKQSGFIVEDRPLQLHCTVVNTVYRKRAPNSSRDTESLGSKEPVSAAQKHPSRGQKRQERIPFSYPAIRSSKAVRSIAPSLVPADQSGGATAHGTSKGNKGSTGNGGPPNELTVELGNYPILSLELCEMGSYDEKGGYKSVGGISLLPIDLERQPRNASKSTR